MGTLEASISDFSEPEQAGFLTVSGRLLGLGVMQPPRRGYEEVEKELCSSIRCAAGYRRC